MIRLLCRIAPSAGAGPDTGHAPLAALRLKKRSVVISDSESFFGRPGAIVTLSAGGVVVSALVLSAFVVSMAAESRFALSGFGGVPCCTGGVSTRARVATT